MAPRILLFLCLTAGISATLQGQLKIQAVLNSASFQPGMPRRGALASVFVSGLTGPPGITVAPSLSLLPQELAGITVTVNGATAPILAVAIPSKGQNGQINIQVPLERNSTLQSDGFDNEGTLEVRQQSQADVLTPLTPPSWGGFLMDENGYAIAQHASDYSLVTLQNPAHAGETIIAYATDFFTVWPPPPIGGCLFPSGSFTDTPALQTSFQGLAPALVGIEQINFVVPAHQQSGDWALFYNSGSCTDGSGYKCGSVDVIGASSPYVKLPVR